MSYLNNGNYPPGVTQAMIDDYFGPAVSDAIEDELSFQLEVQDMRAKLLSKIKEHKGALGVYLNEELEGALLDAARDQQWLLDKLIEEEAENADDEKAEADERRYNARWDEDAFLSAD